MVLVTDFSEKFREKFAAVQHEIWSHWMEYLFSKCFVRGDGNYLIPADFVKHWKRQMRTPYGELTETEKESDRDQADKILAGMIEEMT